MGLQDQAWFPELACVSKEALQWSHACQQSSGIKQRTHWALSPQSLLAATYSSADHHRDSLKAHVYSLV